MLEDVYAEVRRLVVVLREEQAPDVAEELDRAMYGSTSGEILADLGFHLKAALRRRGALTPATRARLKALLRDVDVILRRAGRS
jgi:hypothetical protein